MDKQQKAIAGAMAATLVFLGAKNVWGHVASSADAAEDGAIVAHEGDVAPGFDLKGLDGRRVNLAQYRGHPALVHFWATWCGVCVQEMPSVVALQQRYADRGVGMVGLSLDKPTFGFFTGSIRSFAKEHQMAFPIAIAGNDLAAAYGVTGVPETFLLDGRGYILKHYIGAPAEPDDIEAALQARPFRRAAASTGG